MAKAITEAVVKILEAPKDHIFVIFKDIPKTHLIVGGVPVSKRSRSR